MSAPLPSGWGTWVEQGVRLLAAPPLRRNEQTTRGPDDPKFALGDFLVNIPSQHVDLLAEALHVDSGQVRIYRDVATKIPPGQRVGASWTVHRDLRDRPDLLRPGLTVRQAGALLGKKPIDARPDQRLTLEERAEKVRAGLADPAVYAVIDSELAHGRAERQVRSRARQVHSEHHKRGRELETELREAREAKSPFEATVKAELDVNRAAQLVEAIQASLDDLPQPDRLLDALADLNAAIVALLLERRPFKDDLAGPIVVSGKAWPTRPARAELTDSNQR